jgi:UDP-N-acetyl-D-galactosamine dehydrogenase
MREYGIKLHNYRDLSCAQAIVVAVAHREYVSMNSEMITSKLDRQGVIIDVKAVVNIAEIHKSNFSIWRL